VQVGSSEFLLPKQGRQRYFGITSEEVENTTTFAGCREYRGESTVTFFPPAGTAGGSTAQGAPAKAGPLPAHLPFEFELTTRVSLDRAAALALVEGRLLRVQITPRRSRRGGVVLKLRTAEAGGVKIPLEAVRNWAYMQRNGGSLPILLPQPGEENSGVFQLQGDRTGLEAGFRSVWITAGGAK
jgi:hypothetical protein